MNDRGKLGKFLKKVIDWRWDEFCAAEQDINYKSFEASVFSLVRTAAEGKLGAIKLAIDRVDGKIETPVEVVYPKVWMLFPEAKSVSLEVSEEETPSALPGPEVSVSEDVINITEDEEIDVEPPVSMSLRETLEKMADQPRQLTRLIKERKTEVEKLVKNNGGKSFGDDENAIHSPLVKSIIAANLLQLAEDGNFEAVTEVFDQIDGKMVETLRVLGEDIYLTSYVEEAPKGAVKNKDGVYMIEAAEVTDHWNQRLKANL